LVAYLHGVQVVVSSNLTAPTNLSVSSSGFRVLCLGLSSEHETPNTKPESSMHILLSNDDGYFAPALAVLAGTLSRIAEVTSGQATT
ncbi:MAG: hypothetical protein ACREVA_09735, partial [Burkholderiales bacterium]